MTPLRNNVIVEYIEPPKETFSGIILRTAQDPAKGLVVSIGSEVTDVTVGEKVMIDWNKATKIEDNIYTVSVENIILVFED